jgi:membrane dipeptidase
MPPALRAAPFFAQCLEKNIRPSLFQHNHPNDGRDRNGGRKNSRSKNYRPMICFAHSPEKLAEILGQGEGNPIAMIHCVEGAHSLNGKLENLDILFQREVAYMILAHFFENELVHPCYPWSESIEMLNCFRGDRNIWLGLKPFGEQVVERMVELGMLIDVSHCTHPDRAGIYDIVGNRTPIFASHVGAFEINPDPYNLKDWEINSPLS